MKLALPCTALLLAGAALPVSEAVLASDDFTYDAVAQPSRVLHLGAATDGLLTEVSVDRGDLVSAGDVVARLDTRVDEAEARLAHARAANVASRDSVLARIDDVKRRLADQEALLLDGFITPEEVDATRTELRLEQLNLAQDAEDRAMERLRAQRADAVLEQGLVICPIDGVVTERLLSPGELLSRAGQPEVLTVAQLDPLFVEVHVPVELYEQLEPGDVASVQLDAPGRPIREATLRVKDRDVDTASRTFRVRLELANPDHELPSGLRCRVRFEN